jgi:peptide/nickel transport system permease protein
MRAPRRDLCDMEAVKILHPEGHDARLPLGHKDAHGTVRRLWGDRVALLGLAVILCTALAAVFAPELSPADPIKNNLLERLTPPMWSPDGTSSYPLGTDTLGRDVLSRLLYGARISLFVGVSAVVLSSVLGVSLGLIAGYYGGWLDDVLMRLGDIQLAFPILVLAIAVLAVLGASLGNVILVLGISGWITFARVARAETLSLKEREFVEAARAIGVPDRCILWQHILPNVLSSITVVATFSVARVIIAEASLSFLGLGVPPPTASWGAMLDEGRNYITTAWWLALFPGLAILILVLGINLVGDWVRDILDPRMERGM